MPNPVDIIKEDHRKVEGLFADFKGCDKADHDTRRDIANQIIKELAVHAKMEEKYFYPDLKEAMGDDKAKPVEDAIAEHHAARVLLMELKLMPVDADQFDSRMHVLEETIMHHVEEEESKLLPFAEETINADEMERVGKEMAEYKEGLYATVLDKLLGDGSN